MRNALLVGVKDLRLRLRDRTAIIVAFIAPVVLAAIISFAFGRDPLTFRTTLAIADLDGSEVSRSFLEGIRAIPVIEDAVRIKTVASSEEAGALVRRHEAGAAIVIPGGFGDAVRAGQTAGLNVIREVEAPVAGEFAEAIAEGFAAEINAGRLAIQTAVAAGALSKPGSPGLQALVQKAVEGRLPASLVDGPIGARKVKPASYFGPSMAIFFLFFTVQFGPLGILAERRDGTLARLLASPTKSWAIVTGKVISSFVLGLASIVTMIVITTLLLDATWGDPLAVAALTLAIVFAAVGITGLVIVSARTIDQAQNVTSIVAGALALLGGNFIPINEAPAAIRALSKLTPNGWALRGFTDLTAEGGGIASVLTPLGAIIAFGVVASALALGFGRRMLAR